MLYQLREAPVPAGEGALQVGPRHGRQSRSNRLIAAGDKDKQQPRH